MNARKMAGMGVAAILLLAAGAVASTRSLNGIGYTATNAVDYDWIDISTSGTQILDDHYSWDRVYVPMEFGFSLYDNSCPGIEIGAGGFLVPSYGLITPSASPGGVENLRQCNQNGVSVISPWFDTLTTYSSQSSQPTSAVYYQTTGSPGSRQMIVQWQDVDHTADAWNGGNNGAVTFQTILYEGTNEIKFQYKDVNFENCPVLSGAQNGAIGITDGHDRLVQWSSGQPSVQDGSAILLAPKQVSNPFGASVMISPHVDLRGEGHAIAEISYYPEPTEWDPHPMLIRQMSIGNAIHYTEDGWEVATVSASVRIGDAEAMAGGGLRYRTDSGSDGTTAYFCFQTDGQEMSYVNVPPNWFGMADAHLWFNGGSINGEVSIMGLEGAEIMLLRTEYDADGIAMSTTTLPLYNMTTTSLETPYGTGVYLSNGQNYYYVEYTVPEPATLGLLALGGLAAIRRRRK